MKKRTLGLMAWLLLVAMLTPAWATIIGALPYTLTNGSTADATQVMANYNKIITDTNANAAHNGVNSDITALTALSTPITPAQGGTTVYIGGTSTGSANAQVVASPVPTGMTLAAGQGICFIAGFTNTGATTLNANSLGAKNVFRQSPSGVQALTGGELVSSGWSCATYDGTQYVLQTSGYLRPGIGPLTSLASATTTDLGTIVSHNVNITGTTTITAFGSSASTTFPVYSLKFSGALTLTYNGTSLITPGARNIVTAANDTAVALYLGSGNWQVVSYTPAVQPPTMALATTSATGLTLTNNAGTPNTKADIAADSAVLVDTNGFGIRASSVSCTVNMATTGANALDTGSQNSSTWYNFYIISTGSTTACLASLSATAPTMPSGYVYKMRVGAMYSDASTHFSATLQQGRRTFYTSGAQAVASTNSLSNSSTSISTLVPPTAVSSILSCNVASNANGGAGASPNSSWGSTVTAATATPPYFACNGGGSGQIGQATADVPLQTAQTVFVSTGTAGTNRILLNGWVDKVVAD